MAQAAITIPAQAGRTAQAVAKRAAAATGKASFANVMAQEQDRQGVMAKTKTGQTRTASARMPENGGIPLRNNTVLAGRTPTDMMRMQSFNKASMDLNQINSINSMSQGSGKTAIDAGGNLKTATNLRTLAAGGNGRGFALTSGDFIHTSRRVSRPDRVKTRRAQNVTDAGIGKLAAKFESGSDGIAAIGYDSTGGTSYGKYQIASKVGSMKSFLAFLDGEAPDLAKRLRSAGPANTGSRRGAMPNEWRAIAKEQPERFEQLQEAYIHESHYKPALNAIVQNTGIDASDLSAAMREVIWSTAVQHGPAGAARIFARADSMSGKADDSGYERKMINNVYSVRAGQFGSSTPQVRNAVRSRFREERQMALNMLDNKNVAATA